MNRSTSKALGATVFLAFFVLVSCASEIMESYIGKSITEPILDYGPPANVIDIGNNRRAFQWQITSSGAMPMTSPSYGTVYGAGGYATISTTTTTYMPYSQTCMYTLTATQRGDDWIVDGYRKPTMMCE